VSLKSKNEEIAKLEAEKDSAQNALATEVKRSEKLNEMLSDALEDLRRQKADLDSKEDFIVQQEEMARDLSQRLHKVILQPPSDEIEFWTQGETALCNAMQDRVSALEKQVAAQTVQVTVLRTLLEREIASRDAAREATIAEFTSLQKQHAASQQMLSVALARIKSASYSHAIQPHSSVCLNMFFCIASPVDTRVQVW
jgi:DNA repair exonuclease SbcCD ATPase subunit